MIIQSFSARNVTRISEKPNKYKRLFFEIEKAWNLAFLSSFIVNKKNFIHGKFGPSPGISEQLQFTSNQDRIMKQVISYDCT